MSERGVDLRALLGAVAIGAVFLSPVAVVVSACRERFVPRRAGARGGSGLEWPAITRLGTASATVLTLFVLPR